MCANLSKKKASCGDFQIDFLFFNIRPRSKDNLRR
jgi:hypothetical protein